MRTLPEPSRGQSIVETVLLIPLLLILLAGGYWSFRSLSLSGAAESASHTHLLRTGRNLSSLESRLSKTIHPGNDTVRLAAGSRSLAAGLPLFGGMAGNNIASAAVSCPKEQVGGFVDLPSHDVRRDAEGAVDCWGKNTRSGTKIRGIVSGIVLTGAVR
ncbi:MAG: pilus assembly protein [Deltaproteobacteria bacterium]|nr:pilus assembly protein [Deltaproteobacteria bacterium]